MSACLCEFALCNEPLQYGVMCTAPCPFSAQLILGMLLCWVYVRRFVCGYGFGVNIHIWFTYMYMKGFQWTGGLAASTLCTHSLLLMAVYAIHSMLACFCHTEFLSKGGLHLYLTSYLLYQVHEGCPALPGPHCVLLPFSQAPWGHPSETTCRGEVVHKR